MIMYAADMPFSGERETIPTAEVKSCYSTCIYNTVCSERTRILAR